MASDAGHCAALVRSDDPDRYYATLFAPEDVRPALFALYAFSVEVARVRDTITNPLPGEIRLQWWRDTLTSAGPVDGATSPVAAALDLAVRRYALPRQALLNLVDARDFDLYDDPMPAAAELEGYLGETASALIRLASLILAGGRDPGGAEAAGHAGLAYGLTGLLRALPWHARRGQLYLPMTLLSEHGVTRDDVVLGRGGPGLVATLAALRAKARDHLAAFERLRPGLAPEIRPAFLPATLVPGYLRRMERPGYDPFRTVVDIPAWRKIATFWRAARR